MESANRKVKCLDVSLLHRAHAFTTKSLNSVAPMIKGNLLPVVSRYQCSPMRCASLGTPIV